MHDLRPVSLLGIMPRTSVVRCIEVRSLTVPLFLNTLEQSGLSTWLRESDSVFGFYFILTFHTVGFALMVGPNAAMDLRLLGVAREIPLPSLRSWFNLMWLGLGINVASGIFLVLAY